MPDPHPLPRFFFGQSKENPPQNFMKIFSLKPREYQENRFIYIYISHGPSYFRLWARFLKPNSPIFLSCIILVRPTLLPMHIMTPPRRSNWPSLCHRRELQTSYSPSSRPKESGRCSSLRQFLRTTEPPRPADAGLLVCSSTAPSGSDQMQAGQGELLAAAPPRSRYTPPTGS